MNEGGACVYIFLEQYGFGPFSHGEIFFHAISYAELSELGGVGGVARRVAQGVPPGLARGVVQGVAQGAINNSLGRVMD